MVQLEMIGQRLKALRGGKPLQEVADALCITVAALEAYEAGKRMPRDEVKISLANYYGVELSTLFFTKEDAAQSDRETLLQMLSKMTEQQKLLILKYALQVQREEKNQKLSKR